VVGGNQGPFDTNALSNLTGQPPKLLGGSAEAELRARVVITHLVLDLGDAAADRPADQFGP
jgi:hypothetical protein